MKYVVTYKYFCPKCRELLYKRITQVKDEKPVSYSERVKCGMNGIFIERGTLNDSGYAIDIIKVPACNLNYQVDRDVFTRDIQIQTAVSMYLYGVSVGREQGFKEAQAALRKALGIVEPEEVKR